MSKEHRIISLPHLYRIRSWYGSLSPGKQTLVQDALVWLVAALCVWWVARGVSFDQFFKALTSADIKLFIGAQIASFFIWWLGDTCLFALLFTFFHKKTTPREVLPAATAQYFLQAINQ
ncbi:MAG: hypothetical protein ACREQ4_16900, partial [Candidatus Binataceae bacterium]